MYYPQRVAVYSYTNDRLGHKIARQQKAQSLHKAQAVQWQVAMEYRKEQILGRLNSPQSCGVSSTLALYTNHGCNSHVTN